MRSMHDSVNIHVLRHVNNHYVSLFKFTVWRAGQGDAMHLGREALLLRTPALVGYARPCLAVPARSRA
jgi:hypothetical protein